ncbi:MAG: hypothetical protein PHU78_01105 [Heliobacteriaceae bacterium]|nr:hypothetical protein [Heliobacteriaceae bacterium]
MAENFVQHLWTGNNEAIALSEGAALQSALATAKQSTSTQINEIYTESVLTTDNFVRYLVAVEYLLPNESLDVVFYHVDCVKKPSKNWVVTGIAEIGLPTPPGCVFAAHTSEFNTAYEAFLRAIKANQRDNAKALAVSLAKEKAGRIPAPPGIDQLSGTIIAAGERTRLVRFDYQAGDRPASDIVGFYRTSEGWRIAGLAY